MEDLNLSQLSQSLRNSILPSKPYPMKRLWTLKFPKGSVPTRRSTRVADKPYADVAVEDLGITRRVYASDEARSYATMRAEELKSGLESGFPSFVKPMLQPHVSGEFWLTVNATDLHSRNFLQLPKPVGVDFRASCFCHKNTIDMGYICSVCLSIFCKHHKKCSTCGSIFGQAQGDSAEAPDRKRKSMET